MSRFVQRWSVLAACALASACGSRTGLPGEGSQDSNASHDGGHDDFRDPTDASAAGDATETETGTGDAARESEASLDARDEEPDLDALIPFDSGATPLPSACPDSAATLIYLLGKDGALMSLYPPTLDLQRIGIIRCPLAAGSTSSPNSMAVNHEGIAYVAYDDGQLFRVSLTNAACTDTGFSTASFQFGPRFGMAYAASATTAGETLYIAQNSTSSSQLAAIDPVAKTLRVIGTINPAILSPELTGDASGDLFAFYAVTPAGGTDATSSAIARIDPVTAQRSAPASLPNVQQSGPNGGAWAFGFWAGDFYTFTDPTQTGSVVTRFRPADGSIVRLTQLNVTVVGAGVSTCAPQ